MHELLRFEHDSLTNNPFLLAEEKPKPDHKLKWIEGIEGVLIKEKPPKKKPNLAPVVVGGIFAAFFGMSERKFAQNVVSSVAEAAAVEGVKSASSTAFNTNNNATRRISSNSWSTDANPSLEDDPPVFDASSLLTVEGSYGLSADAQSVDLDLDVTNGARDARFSTVVVRARYYNGSNKQIWHKDVRLRGKFKPQKTRSVRKTIPSVAGTRSVTFTVMEAW